MWHRQEGMRRRELKIVNDAKIWGQPHMRARTHHSSQECRRTFSSRLTIGSVPRHLIGIVPITKTGARSHAGTYRPVVSQEILGSSESIACCRAARKLSYIVISTSGLRTRIWLDSPTSSSVQKIGDSSEEIRVLWKDMIESSGGRV